MELFVLQTELSLPGSSVLSAYCVQYASTINIGVLDGQFLILLLMKSSLTVTLLKTAALDFVVHLAASDFVEGVDS